MSATHRLLPKSSISERRSPLHPRCQQFYADRARRRRRYTCRSRLRADEQRGEIEVVAVEDARLAPRSASRSRPQRGDLARRSSELANRNAAMAYQAQFGEGVGVAPSTRFDTLRGSAPSARAAAARIECFDISTLQGRETVAALVVAVDGRMRRVEVPGNSAFAARPSRTVGGRRRAGSPCCTDDFASMHEVVLRRYRRVLEHGGPFPDLILIDGGKGQLHAAYDALREVGLERLVAAGLAKEEELLFVRDRADGILLPRESAALHLVQRIRDEAHRFAVTFHRRRRTTRDLRSELDDIHGHRSAPSGKQLLHYGLGRSPACARASRSMTARRVVAGPRRPRPRSLPHFEGVIALAPIAGLAGYRAGVQALVSSGPRPLGIRRACWLSLSFHRSGARVSDRPDRLGDPTARACSDA